MANNEIIGVLIILINCIFSYKGFTDRTFFEKYKFEIEKLTLDKDYKVLITSGFLHVDWLHLLFNMLSLYAFSGPIEIIFGSGTYLLIYFASLIGGNLLALYIHRHHSDYSAVGASGAVSGIIFASIALFPGIEIGMFGIPAHIPGWIYGVVYILYSMYGVKSKRDNIGHEAHLGGALIGMLTAVMLYPESIKSNYLPVLLILTPSLVFIYLIITKPHFLLIDNFYFKTHKKYYSVDHKYNEEKVDRQKEIDRLLDKISKSGIEGLTSAERKRLEEYSKLMK